ncbi:MAG: hypothetical protein ACYC2P_13130 [Paludibacteraceae bacterium]
MKTKLFTLLAAVVLTSTALSAQTISYLHISGQAGLVTNSQQDRKLGLGGSVAWFRQDNLLFNSEKNYFTLTLKGFNNPYGEGKFISSIMNGANDAFNYIGLLAGYRLTAGNAAAGFYAEPRLGAGFVPGGTGFLFSPALGYAFNGIDIAVYSDMGFRGKPLVTGTNNFYTVGLSVGYNIGL